MGKTIIVGITGSIAAYKAADLVSRLRKRDHEIHVVMTKQAQQFIGPLTLQTLSRQPVLLDQPEHGANWKPLHIDLADRADLLLIAPATANVLARLAHGLADDLLGEIALASLAPVLIAPAMNGKMWAHPATRQNVETLTARGVQFIGPEGGMLACGYEGLGRLWEVEGIVERAEQILDASAS